MIIPDPNISSLNEIEKVQTEIAMVAEKEDRASATGISSTPEVRGDGPTPGTLLMEEQKPGVFVDEAETSSLEQQIESELKVTEDDLLEAKALAATMSLESVTAMMRNVLRIHERDPNFPHTILLRIDEFLSMPPASLFPLHLFE